ncbi:MAG: hypothetical protein ACK4YQ_08250 [Phenylobacterium sp.]|uniref:hypothetical protein n=1 Tax=Phenylobacterium sp. TaxID=1871053 RepID=UPI003918EE5F
MLAERLAETGRVLSKEIEGWSPEVAMKLVEYAQAFGVTLDEMRQVADPRLWIILHRAHQGEEAARRQETARAVEQAQAVRPALQVSGVLAGGGGEGDTVSGKGNKSVYKDAEGEVYFWEDTDGGSAFNYGVDVSSFSTTPDKLTPIEDPRRKAQVLENLLDFYKWAGTPVDVLLPYDGKKYWVRVVSGGQWVGPPDAIFRATGYEAPGA